LRWATPAAGGVGLLAAALLLGRVYLGLGIGGMERAAVAGRARRGGGVLRLRRGAGG
jgi:hypothetical protein